MRRDAEQPHRLVPKQPQHPGTIADVELSDDGDHVSANGDIRYEEPLADLGGCEALANSGSTQGSSVVGRSIRSRVMPRRVVLCPTRKRLGNGAGDRLELCAVLPCPGKGVD